MRQLPVSEQAIVHTLKAFTDGEISCDQQAKGGLLGNCTSEELSGDTSLVDHPVYTDPEDIPFGAPKRKRPIYALSWTWQQGKVYATKAKATRGARAWKLWHERWGFKVVSVPGTVGYFAAKGLERRAVVLHEYDKETNERLS